MLKPYRKSLFWQERPKKQLWFYLDGKSWEKFHLHGYFRWCRCPVRNHRRSCVASVLGVSVGGKFLQLNEVSQESSTLTMAQSWRTMENNRETSNSWRKPSSFLAVWKGMCAWQIHCEFNVRSRSTWRFSNYKTSQRAIWRLGYTLRRHRWGQQVLFRARGFTHIHLLL